MLIERHETAHVDAPSQRLYTRAELDAEVAAERARIDAAPTAIIDTRDVLGLCAPAEADFTALYALQGHRVALVDLGLAATDPRFHGLPPYPEGEVVGPCVCGSWPGGKCLRCPVTPNVGAKLETTAARYSNASSGQLADPAGTLAVGPNVALSGARDHADDT